MGMIKLPSAINVIYGDVVDQDVDVLALKYANGLSGADLHIAELLGIPQFSVQKGEYEFIDTRGAIKAQQVLFQGVGPLHRFEYDEIKNFAENAVTLCLTQNPGARSLGIAFHGVAAGLDELAAVSSLIQGLEDGFFNGNEILEHRIFEQLILTNKVGEFLFEGY